MAASRRASNGDAGATAAAAVDDDVDVDDDDDNDDEFVDVFVTGVVPDDEFGGVRLRRKLLTRSTSPSFFSLPKI